MLFADDLVLCYASRENLDERLIEDWRSKLEEMGLKVSKSKTEYLPVHQDGGCKTEVQLRISRAWDKWRELTGVLCGKKIPKKLKVPVYKPVIRPVMLYGAEMLEKFN